MKIIRSLKAAAVVPLLLVSLAFGQRSFDKCGTPIMPEFLSIKAEPSRTEPGVYVFTPICDGVPCEPGRYLYEWKLGDQDYSVQRSPARWFATTGPHAVRLTLGGIKEYDDPDSRYGACPEAVRRAGGCTSVIAPECPRPKMTTTQNVDVQTAISGRRHEEFGKLLEIERGDFRLVLASHDGNPVPLQVSQYPIVLENRTNCTAKVTTEVEGRVGREDVQLEVRQGGKSIPLSKNSGRILVETTLAPQSTAVMLLAAKLPPSLGKDIVGEKLELRVVSKFESVGGACGKEKKVAKMDDLILRAIDPSYLRLLTRHRLYLGDRVRYQMVITNEGALNPDSISILHELEPVWNRESIKYKSFKIDGHRLKKEKYDGRPQAGQYYLHDRDYSDSLVAMVLKPTAKHPLKLGSELVIKFKVRLDKSAPANWNGNDPGDIRLKRNERFVHHAYWTMFSNEGVWYHSESIPPTVVKTKGKVMKIFRWIRIGGAIGASAVVISNQQAIRAHLRPLLQSLGNRIGVVIK